MDNLFERFSSRYIPEPNSGCWIWLGATSKGYGQLLVKGKTHQAHRISFAMAKGDVPQGFVLDHLCRTPCCVNPNHLEPVTIGENTKRGLLYKKHYNAAKTKCSKGHAFTAENILPRNGGKGRACKRCKIIFQRNYRDRNAS